MSDLERGDRVSEPLDWCMTRRRFLFMGAATLGTVTLASVLPGRLFTAHVASYEGQRVGSISGLPLGVPDTHPLHDQGQQMECFLWWVRWQRERADGSDLHELYDFRESLGSLV